MIVAGATAYPRRIDPEPFRAIADEVGALLHVRRRPHRRPDRRRRAPAPGAATPTSSRSPRTRRCAARAAAASCAAPTSARRSTRPSSPGSRAARSSTSSRPRRSRSRRPCTRRSRDYAAPDRRQRRRAGRRPRRAGLPPRVRRHRQPPDARRPAHVRRRADRQGGAARAGPGRHHAQQEHRPRRPPLAVRHERRPHRHAVGHDAGDEGAGDGDHRRAHRPRSAPSRRRRRAGRRARGRRACSARSSRPTPTPRWSGRQSRSARPLAGYAFVGFVAAVVTTATTPVRPLAGAALRLGVRARPTTGGSTPGRRRPSAGWPCSSGCSSAMAVAWQMDRFTTLFAGNSEPLGVVLGGGGDLRRRPVGRPAPSSAPAKVTGIVVAGAVLAWFGVTMFYFRVPVRRRRLGRRRTGSPLVTVIWLLLMANAVNLIDGLDGLAAGIVAIASGTFFLYSQQLDRRRPARAAEHRPAARRHHARHLRGVPAPQLQPGPHLHGRRRGAAARPADGGLDERGRRPSRPEPGLQRPDVLLPRSARHPARDPRRADPRHDVRPRAPGRRRAPASRWRTRTTSTTG